MLCMLALLEALEHAVLAGGLAELAVALGDVGLVAAQLQRFADALRLDALDERLASAQLLGVDRRRGAGRDALLGEYSLEVGVDGIQAMLAAAQARNGLRELLSGDVLAALAQGADAL